jgi:hypothetical protein
VSLVRPAACAASTRAWRSHGLPERAWPPRRLPALWSSPGTSRPAAYGELFLVSNTLAWSGAPRCTMYIAVRGADHVHRRARAPALPRVRPLQPAHRHHGRLALPGRGDEEGPVGHAHVRGHHLLRHDRDQPGLVPDRARRPGRQAGVDRRPHPPARRGQGHRPRQRPGPAARGARRAVHARLPGDAGLLGERGGDGGGGRPGRLDAHRRPGHGGRRRLRQRRRPHQGHGHQGRRERLSRATGNSSTPSR